MASTATKEKNEKWHSDTPVSGMPAEKLLSLGRMKLLTSHPFFGSIISRLPLVESDMVPTTAVTSTGILLWNRKFVNYLKLDDMVAVFCHEVMHIVQSCFDRTPVAAIPEIWNIATDQVINTAILDADFKSEVLAEVCPKEVKELVYQDKISEVRYNNLLKQLQNNTRCKACKKLLDQLIAGQEQQDQGNQGGNEPQGAQGNEPQEGDSLGGNQPGENSSGNPSPGEGDHNCGGGEKHTCNNKSFCHGTGIGKQKGNKEGGDQDWRLVVLEARQTAIQQGKVPGGVLGEWLETLVKPKVNWKQYIRVSASLEFKNRYTYRRLSRRGPALNLRFPGRQPDNKSAAIFIDTSGSIGNEVLRQFLSECVGILEACGCESVWVGLHDVNVYSFGKLDKKAIRSVKVRSGGTSHMDVFKIVENEHDTYEITDHVAMVICLTDLYSDFPNKCSKNVIWAHPNAEGAAVKVPFGRKVRVEMD